MEERKRLLDLERKANLDFKADKLFDKTHPEHHLFFKVLPELFCIETSESKLSTADHLNMLNSEKNLAQFAAQHGLDIDTARYNLVFAETCQKISQDSWNSAMAELSSPRKRFGPVTAYEFPFPPRKSASSSSGRVNYSKFCLENYKSRPRIDQRILINQGIAASSGIGKENYGCSSSRTAALLRHRRDKY